MLPEALAELTREAGGEALLLDAKHSRAIVSDTARLVDICRNLRHHGFTRFVDFTGEHLGGGAFALRLALRCPAHGHALLGLKWKFTQTDAQPTHRSLSTVWPAAGIAEREMFEMLGVPFAGNENLKPLLLEEQFAGNPLRKDFALPTPPRYADGLLQERLEQGMLESLVGRASLPAIEGQGPGARGQGEGTGNREQGAVGSTAVSTSRADRPAIGGIGQTSGSAGFQPADKDDRQDACPTGPRAADLVGAALVRPGDTSENTGRTSAAPTAKSQQDAGAPREDSGHGGPPHGEAAP